MAAGSCSRASSRMTNARISLLRCRPRCPRREVRAPHNRRQAVLLSHGRFAEAAVQLRGLRLLFSWIYDVPSLLAIILFGAGFVAVFWLGALVAPALCSEAVAAGAWAQRHAHHVSAIFRRHLRIAVWASCRR